MEINSPIPDGRHSRQSFENGLVKTAERQAIEDGIANLLAGTGAEFTLQSGHPSDTEADAPVFGARIQITGGNLDALRAARSALEESGAYRTEIAPWQVAGRYAMTVALAPNAQPPSAPQKPETTYSSLLA